jgi:hypothetical protein
MENLDLNFDNYSLEEILNLLNLSVNFGENELKIAKRTVLMTHPDKSGLVSIQKFSYFLVKPTSMFTSFISFAIETIKPSVRIWMAMNRILK